MTFHNCSKMNASCIWPTRSVRLSYCIYLRTCRLTLMVNRSKITWILWVVHSRSLRTCTLCILSISILMSCPPGTRFTHHLWWLLVGLLLACICQPLPVVQHQSLSALQVVVLVAKPPVVPMAARLGLGSPRWQRSGMAVDSLRSSLEQKPKNHCPVRIGRRLQVQVPSLLVQELGCCSWGRRGCPLMPTPSGWLKGNWGCVIDARPILSMWSATGLLFEVSSLGCSLPPHVFEHHNNASAT